MTKRPITLKVASPCSASWDDMPGDDAVRHCDDCNKKVYQISNMSSEQVDEFFMQKRGLRTCVRFFQRADGTLLTSDCSVGKKQKRKKRVLKVVGAAAISASAVGLSLGMQAGSTTDTAADEFGCGLLISPSPTTTPATPATPAAPVKVEEEAQQILGGIEIMGDVAYEPEPIE